MRIKFQALLPVLSAALVSASSVHGADIKRGGLLFENHCVACHDSIIHKQEGRTAKSLDDVRWQVSRWSRELKLGWRQAELEDVALFVNQRFYQFEGTVQSE
jgi:mono/diheme cytochrome c family protein